MPTRSPPKLGPAILEAGHALLLPIVGVAMLYGKVVGVAPTPANAVVAVAFIATGVLIPLDAFGVLSRPLKRATWAMFIAAVVAFVGLNLF